MIWDFPIMPDQASDFAVEIDAMYLTLWGLTAVFTLLVALMVLYFCMRYRRGSRVDRSHPVHTHHALELTWSIVPLLLGLGIFVWGAKVYAELYREPPKNAMEIFAIGKQWMWHLQHTNGVRENNELHIPVGKPVKMTMISQDVIHSFYIPAFRIKRDVLPGQYSAVWFTPTRTGRYHLFCAEYCGTQHSLMGGWVTVMKQDDFQEWLARGGPRELHGRETMVQAGKRLYEELACDTCHGAVSTERGPSLYGLYGRTVQLQDGSRVKADEAYLRESILEPNKKLNVGYEPTMPEYKGQMTEDQALQLNAYIKTLGAREEKPATPQNQTGGTGASAPQPNRGAQPQETNQ